MESFKPFLALAPDIGLGCLVVVHVALSRARRGQGPVSCFAAGGAVGLLCVVSLTSWAVAGANGDCGWWSCMAFNLATFAVLAHGYISFMTLNITSLRIRVLYEIWQSPGMAKKDILTRYGSAHLIETRIDRLVSSGHLVERGGRLFVGKRILLLVFSAIELMKHLILGRGNRLLSGVAGQKPEMSE